MVMEPPVPATPATPAVFSENTPLAGMLKAVLPCSVPVAAPQNQAVPLTADSVGFWISRIVIWLDELLYRLTRYVVSRAWIRYTSWASQLMPHPPLPVRTRTRWFVTAVAVLFCKRKLVLPPPATGVPLATTVLLSLASRSSSMGSASPD